MTVDLAYIRSQVERVIETAPTFISTSRKAYEEDGYGGRKVSSEAQMIQQNLKVLFDNSSLSDLSTSVSPAGRKVTKPSIRLWILYDPENPIDIQRGDEVNVRDSLIFYNVTEVNNVLEQDFLLEVKLELRD